MDAQAVYRMAHSKPKLGTTMPTKAVRPKTFKKIKEEDEIIKTSSKKLVRSMF